MPDLPRVGEEFAGYWLRSRLGHGGMSVVFEAENWRLGNVVALKIIAPELANDDTFRTRFLQESRIAAQLNHPHVVPIMDSGASDGLLWIAMRYVAGTDLGQMIAERGRLEPGIAAHLLSQAALALDAAHRRDLVHRDVKPANLLLERTSDDADPDHLYLADFGITKRMAGLGRLTSAGRYLGTPLYLAPEQAQQLAVLGTADQYALGCVLFECLTGRVPFERGSSTDIVQAHIEQAPPRVTWLRPELPPALDGVFARVLAKDPRERYPSCRDFMAAARAALAVTGGRPSGGRPSGDPPDGFPPDGLQPNGFQPTVRPSGFLPTAPPPGLPALPEVAHDSADRALRRTHSMDGAVMRPLPGPGWSPGPEQQGAGGPGGPLPLDDDPRTGGGPSRRVRFRRRRDRRVVLTWAGLAVLFAAAVAGGVLLAVYLKADASRQLRSASAATSASPSELVSVLDQTEHFTGRLRMSACTSVSTTNVQCENPDPAIAAVTFATYPSLTALYTKYQEIIDNLTKKPFGSVENAHVCGSLAPDPTAENTWNHSDGYSTSYSVGQMAAGRVSTDVAMGRVFCEQTPNGSAIFVWTQDSGDLLGYATGSEASHEQVWEWYYAVHHQIIFPGQPAMSGMPMSPGASSPSPARPARSPAESG
jgi:serine/threonine protein kinase